MSRVVELRNGERAVINGRALLGEGGHEEFLQGTRGGSYELWLANGRWSYRDVDHPFDIIRHLPWLPAAHGAAESGQQPA